MPVAVKKVDRNLASLLDPCVVLSEFQVRRMIEESKKLLRSPETTTKDAAFHYEVLATGYLRLHKDEDAVEAFRNACRLDPKHLMHKHNLGVALHKLGRLGDALNVFIEVSEENPTAISLGNMAEVLEGLGLHDEAIEIFEEALKAPGSHNTKGLLDLASVAAEIGLSKEAVELYARHLALKQGVALGNAKALAFIHKSPSRYKTCLEDRPALQGVIARGLAWGAELETLGKALPNKLSEDSAEEDAASLEEFEATQGWRARATKTVLGGDENA